MTTAADFYNKLLAEHGDVLKDLTDHRRAINAAFTAWHLWEWVWNQIVKPDMRSPTPTVPSSFPGESASSFRTKDAFQTWVVAKCPAMKDMEAITVGAKHLGNTNLEDHQGDFSGQGDWDRKGFDVSRLKKKTPGGFSSGFSTGFAVTKIEDFDRLLDDVVSWWGWFFAQVP